MKQDTHRGAYAAVLASMPKAGPRRLEKLLEHQTPKEAWDRLRSGVMPDCVGDRELRKSWVKHCIDVDIAEVEEMLNRLNVQVSTKRDADYPARLKNDIFPAPIIFRQGRNVNLRCNNVKSCSKNVAFDNIALDNIVFENGVSEHSVFEHSRSENIAYSELFEHRPSVTIIGTRRCSPTGRSVAFELGAGLAEAGIVVVSGLALGIDGAAHRGALSVDGAAAVGVVGSGIDVVYPRANSDLWALLGQKGTLLSEAPLHAKPEPWRFPARNRLLAALADVVVVVESKRAGGSMLTVEEALKRDVTVMAVPGSIRNAASVGTNALISDGCAPACSVEDILTAIGLSSASSTASLGNGGTASGSARSASSRSASSTKRSMKCAVKKNTKRASEDAVDATHNSVNAAQQQVLDAIDDNPVGIDQLMLRTNLSVKSILVALADLEQMGLITQREGQFICVNAL